MGGGEGRGPGDTAEAELTECKAHSMEGLRQEVKGQEELGGGARTSV